MKIYYKMVGSYILIRNLGNESLIKGIRQIKLRAICGCKFWYIVNQKKEDWQIFFPLIDFGRDVFYNVMASKKVLLVGRSSQRCSKFSFGTRTILYQLAK
jgi:hypothetical protein